jgi:hypothetical protein
MPKYYTQKSPKSIRMTITNLKWLLLWHRLKLSVDSDPSKRSKHSLRVSLFFILYSSVNRITLLYCFLFFYKVVPELEFIIGVEQMSNFINELSPETLKECFNNLMTADPQLIKNTLQKLLKRLYSCGK